MIYITVCFLVVCSLLLGILVYAHYNVYQQLTKLSDKCSQIHLNQVLNRTIHEHITSTKNH